MFLKKGEFVSGCVTVICVIWADSISAVGINLFFKYQKKEK